MHFAFAVAQAEQAAPHFAVGNLGLSYDLLMPLLGLGSREAITMCGVDLAPCP